MSTVPGNGNLAAEQAERLRQRLEDEEEREEREEQAAEERFDRWFQEGGR